MILNFFSQRNAVILALLMLTGVIVTSWHMMDNANNIIEERALENAENLALALKEFRHLYTSEVVERAQKHGMSVKHDYLEDDNAIPLPATLTKMLAKTIGDDGHGESARLFSAYPFPWNKKGGIKDAFEQEALAAFKENPDQPFHRIGNVNGVKVYRYAIADIMVQSCVSCHNSLADSPKRDWQVGDVRGALEIAIPIQRIAAASRAEVKKSITKILGVTLFAICMLLLFVFKLTEMNKTLEQMVEKRTTNLKAREQQVLEEKQQLSAVIDNVIDGIITIGERGTIESFNPAARRIFGYSDEEVLGQNIKMLMPEPYHSEHDGYLDHYITSGEKKIIGIGREVVGRRKDGSTFPMELAVSEVSINNNRHFVGITRDISERKAFEKQVLEEKKQLSAVIDNVVDGIITIGERGAIESFNPAARRIFGYSDEEVLGQNIKMLMPEPYHSEHDGYLDHHITTGEKKVIGIGREVVGRRKDGSTFPMELAVSEVTINDKRYFVGITRDITERKRVEQMQKEFVSTVSHELRTPLTSIRGSLGLILGGVTGELPEKAKALLTIANNNSERLIHLINDILDMEKIGAGKMQFDYTVVDLTPVVELAVESNKGYGEQLNVCFELVTVPNDSVMVRIDEKRIAQVLSNLLSNAAKYSPTDDKVEISIQADKKNVRISVHDHGKGIPEKFKPKIFDKFSQADSSDTRQKGGTGLGLNITKVIVEQHKGSIGFESGESIGTTFFVDLPIWVEEKRVIPASSNAEPDTIDSPLLLIVEDDKDVSRLLSLLLEKEGYRYHQAYNYEQAVQQIKNHHYDAITMDLIIPGGNGLTLLRELRENKETAKIPVVVVSVRANENQLEYDADAFNMVDWIEKPIDENRLLGSIKTSLAHLAQSSAHILHVEDDPDIATVVDSVLGGECRVTHAATLQAARDCLARESFDLVLLDIGLPDGSGLDLLPTLNTPEHQTPVMIFSAQDVTPEVASQVKGTLVKSKTDNEKLMQQIKSALKKW